MQIARKSSQQCDQSYLSVCRDPHLLQKMSRLAREELRHFEQVVDLMTELDIEYARWVRHVMQRVCIN